MNVGRYVLVAAFGTVGTAARLALVDLLPRVTAHDFPWATLCVNIVGSFLLGIVYAITPGDLPAVWRAAIGIGALGAFTTFSTLMWETMQLFDAGEAPKAITYVAASLALGMTAVIGGTYAARAF